MDHTSSLLSCLFLRNSHLGLLSSVVHYSLQQQPNNKNNMNIQNPKYNPVHRLQKLLSACPPFPQYPRFTYHHTPVHKSNKVLSSTRDHGDTQTPCPQSSNTSSESIHIFPTALSHHHILAHNSWRSLLLCQRPWQFLESQNPRSHTKTQNHEGHQGHKNSSRSTLLDQNTHLSPEP